MQTQQRYSRIDLVTVLNAPERLNIHCNFSVSLKALRCPLIVVVSAQVFADVSVSVLSTIAGIIVVKLCVIKSATRR